MPTKRVTRARDPFGSRLERRMVAHLNADIPRESRSRKAITPCYKEVDTDDEDDLVFVSTSKKAGEGLQVIELDSSSDESTKYTKSIISIKSDTPITKDEPVTEDSCSGKIFKRLPVEVHQTIASFLPDDHDVYNYALMCKDTSLTITPAFWRLRAVGLYDIAEGLTSEDIFKKYAFRSDVSRKWTCFDLKGLGGVIPQASRDMQVTHRTYCLEMLKSLILESDAKKVVGEDGRLVVHGLNFQFIQDLVSGQNGRSYIDILDSIFNTDQDTSQSKYMHTTTVISAKMDNTLLYVIQLCLAPITLHPKFCNKKVSHFEMSQYQVYDTAHRQPVFVGKYRQDINVRWLLHNVNFFKYQLKAEEEGLLAHAYKYLESDQVPQAWVGKIKAGVNALGRHWKGAYTYMGDVELRNLRYQLGSEDSIHVDCLDAGETFQDISLFFDEKIFGEDKWPTQWEEILCSDPFTRNNASPGRRSSPRKEVNNKPPFKQFWGTCRGRDGHFFGRLHAMQPQQGIHGFQRIVMMKFYTKIDSNGFEGYDPDQVWGYEGCVLPGGSIIAGRWWDARNDGTLMSTASGPFIWWNVDRSTSTPPIKETDAFDFLDSVPDLSLGFV